MPVPLPDHLGSAAATEGDDGTAARHRLQGRDPEVLLVRLDERAAGAVRLAQRLGVEPPLESHARAREAFEARSLGTDADDAERKPHAVRDADRALHPLVRHERRDDEERRIGYGRRPAAGVKNAASTGGWITGDARR